jgi:hypothetical protein
MLAEIFMLRFEAAARLQQETAFVSSSPFIPFTPNNQFLFKDRAARPDDRRRRLEMGESRKSDWPIFFLLLLVGALLTASTPLPAKGQQPPLREGCRGVDALRHRHNVALVYLCVGDAIALKA